MWSTKISKRWVGALSGGPEDNTVAISFQPTLCSPEASGQFLCTLTASYFQPLPAFFSSLPGGFRAARKSGT